MAAPSSLTVWYRCQTKAETDPTSSLYRADPNHMVADLVNWLCDDVEGRPFKGTIPSKLEVLLFKANFTGEKTPPGFDETQPLRPGLGLASFQTTDETPLLVKGPASVAGSSLPPQVTTGPPALEELAERLNRLETVVSMSSYSATEASKVGERVLYNTRTTTPNDLLGGIPAWEGAAPTLPRHYRLSFASDEESHQKSLNYLFTALTTSSKSVLQAHDTHSHLPYPRDPDGKIDQTITRKNRDCRLWTELVLPVEIKADITKDQKEVVGEVVSRIMTGFRKQPRRKLFFGIVADSGHVQVIRVEKAGNDFQFTTTNILIICHPNTRTPGEGLTILARLMSATPEQLGHFDYVAPAWKDVTWIPPFRSSQLNISTFTVIREGDGDRAVVFRVSSSSTEKEFLAAKLGAPNSPKIKHELEVLRSLSTGCDIPFVRPIGCGTLGNRDVLLISPYGRTILSIDDDEPLLEYIQQINDQLRFAHTRQYLHRDLSPSNIIISNRRAYLIDWGEASKDNQQPARPTATYCYSSLKVHRAAADGTEVVWTKRDDFEGLFFTFLSVASGHRLPWKRDLVRTDSVLKKAGLVKDVDSWNAFIEQKVGDNQHADELSRIRELLFAREPSEVDTLF